MPGSMGVIFELRRAATRPGETLCVVGARPELGCWRPLPQDLEEEARSLRTSPAMYPSWASRAPIWFELGAQPDEEVQLEYKFVRDMRGVTGQSQSQATWEAHLCNRRISLPAEDGGCWLVSHGCWGCDVDAPQVARLPPKDLASRRAAMGMDTARSSTSRPPPAGARSEAPGILWMNLPLVPKAAVPELQQPRGRGYLLMTPREEGDMNNSPTAWTIEAEFSNFSRPPSSSSDLEEDARDELLDSAADGRLLREELELENERLRGLLAEACAREEQLALENEALRDCLAGGGAGLRDCIGRGPRTGLEEDEGGFLEKGFDKEIRPQPRIAHVYA